jgi:hypothetical protein
MGLTYTFVALTAEGRSPFLDVRMLEGGQDATAHARYLLNEHGSCARIEIWDRSVRLLVIERDPGGLDGVVLDGAGPD